MSYVSTIVCDQDGPPRDEDGDIGHSELEYMYSALLVQRFDARATLERSQMESSGTDDRSQRRAARNHMRTMLSDERRQLELSHYRVRGDRPDRSQPCRPWRFRPMLSRDLRSIDAAIMQTLACMHRVGTLPAT